MKSLPLILLLAAACGGSSPAPSKPAEPKSYKAMSFAERKAYMNDVVLPKARSLFVTMDPTFEKMNCETCHGDTAKDGTFKMPNPKIKPLPNTEEAMMAWMAKDADAAKWAKFMAEDLEPTMAKLVDKTPFDPKTKTGDFSCMACHTLTAAAAD